MLLPSLELVCSKSPSANHWTPCSSLKQLLKDIQGSKAIILVFVLYTSPQSAPHTWSNSHSDTPRTLHFSSYLCIIDSVTPSHYFFDFTLGTSTSLRTLLQWHCSFSVYADSAQDSSSWPSRIGHWQYPCVVVQWHFCSHTLPACIFQADSIAAMLCNNSPELLNSLMNSASRALTCFANLTNSFIPANWLILLAFGLLVPGLFI